MVKWNDAHSPLDTDVIDSKNIDEQLHKVIPMHTVGWLLKEDLNGVSIGSEWCGDDDYRSTTFIPRVLIVSVHRLSRSRKLHPDPSPSFDGGLTCSQP
jgi:hypothetical protein